MSDSKGLFWTSQHSFWMFIRIIPSSRCTRWTNPITFFCSLPAELSRSIAVSRCSADGVQPAFFLPGCVWQWRNTNKIANMEKLYINVYIYVYVCACHWSPSALVAHNHCQLVLQSNGKRSRKILNCQWGSPQSNSWYTNPLGVVLKPNLIFYQSSTIPNGGEEAATCFPCNRGLEPSNRRSRWSSPLHRSTPNGQSNGVTRHGRLANPHWSIF